MAAGKVSTAVVLTAIQVSLVVGTILNLINNGEALLVGEEVPFGPVLLNYLVPFLVSAYSGSKADSSAGLRD